MKNRPASVTPAMKKTMIFVMLVFAVILMMQGNVSVGAQDKYEMKALNGITFSEIREYER